MTPFEKAKFDEKGLLTAIVQDNRSGQVLMCAFMNRDALAKTLETGKMTYFSRSRNKLWIKGEESGHTQIVKDIRFDCDGDAVLCKVEQEGGACHEGWRSCFSYQVQGTKIVENGEKLFDPDSVYGKSG